MGDRYELNEVKTTKKKNLIRSMYLLLLPALILLVGIGLLAAEFITAGGILAVIGFIPLVIVSVISFVYPSLLWAGC